jgi:hypothetical protein
MDSSERSFNKLFSGSEQLCLTLISREKARDLSKDSFALSVILPPVGCSDSSIITGLPLRRVSYAYVVKIQDNYVI